MASEDLGPIQGPEDLGPAGAIGSQDLGPVETSPKGPSFTEQFSEGFDFGGGSVSGFLDRLKEANLGVKAGGIITESVARAIGFREEAEAAERSKKFEQWQPRIWDAQDKMNAIENKNSIEYQAAYENVQNLRRNMRDDLNGDFDPSGDFSFSDLADAVKDNPGFMVGRMASDLMLDPGLLLVPGGALAVGQKAAKFGKAAKLAAEAAGAAAVAGTWTGLEEAIAQKEKNINAPIDINSVANATVMGAGFGVAVPFVEKSPGAIRATFKATRAGDLWNARTLSQIERNAQQIYLDSVNSGNPIDKDVAVNIAIGKHQKFRAETLRNKDAFMSETVLQQVEQPKGRASGVRKAKQYIAESAETVLDKWNKFTQPTTSTLRNMGYPNIARRLNEHDMNLGTEIHRKQEIAQRFSKAYDKLSESEQKLAAFHINNGTFDQSKHQFSATFGRTFDDVRDMLDVEHGEMLDAGMTVGRIENYFPRQFDYERFAKDNDIVLSSMNKEFAKAINEKLGDDAISPSKMTNELINRHLTANEIAMVMQKKVASMSPDASIATTTDSLQGRTVDEITPDMMEYYDDPRGALHDHINRVTVKVQDRNFFGGPELNKMKQPGADISDEEMLDLFIRDDLNRLVNSGRVRIEDFDKIKDIMQARFIGAKKPTHKIIGGAKNLMYGLTLGNPVAASVQLGDMAAATYMNGLRDTLNGVIKNAGKDVEGFDMDDFGLQHIPEMETMGWTKIFAELSMKAGGFQAIDRLGKNTILNSTYRHLRRKMADPNLSPGEKFKYFDDRYGARLGDDEVRKIMEGVASGDPTNPSARLAMYSDLTRVQPVSMSEMPVGYMNHPNGRIAYMLKTFTLKQIDLMRQESLRMISNGAKNKDKKQIAQGVLAMGKIIGTIGLGNAGVDFTKRWIMGDEDLSFSNNMFNSVMRNYGLSQYTLDTIQRGEPFKAALEIATPPFSVVTRPLWSVFGVDNGARPTDLLPVIGKPIDIALDRRER